MQVEPRVIPVLLIAEGRFVKTRRFSDPVYVGDPVNVLSIFNEFVVDEIIILQEGRVLEHGDRAALAGDEDSRFSELLRTGLEGMLV